MKESIRTMIKLALFLLLLNVLNSYDCKKLSVTEKAEDNFDYLVFRQIWPPCTCLFPGKNTCSVGKNVSTWVVHGLW